MPPKKPLDDAKVMDVSKPGSTKPVGTSRPVMAAPIVTTLGAMVGIDKDPNLQQPTVGAPVAPSQAHKTIAPINEGVKPETEGEAAAAEPAKVEEAAVTTPEPEKKAEDSGDSTESSESGAVDALASNVATKKAEEKALEELTKKDAAVQEMINTKKYFVPLAHDSTKHKKGHLPFIILGVFLVVLVAGYAAVDEGMVDPGFDVPYHVLKK